MASVIIAKILKEKRTGAKSDQALRKILNFLDHNKNHKIRLEDFIDIMEEHNVDIDPEEILELCELTEETGEICHSTLIIFVKNSKVWKILEKQAPIEEGGPPAQTISLSNQWKGRTKIEAISLKANKVHAAFNVLDSDRDGFVTKSDFKRKFHSLNSKQIDIVFRRYDRSRHGRLSFVEFKNFMSRRPLPLRLESRRNSILSLPCYTELALTEPPSYSSLLLAPQPRDPPSYSSLPEEPPRYSSLGDPELQEEEVEEISNELSTMSEACKESLEELSNLGVEEVEEGSGDESKEHDEAPELSTISEEMEYC